MRTQERRTGARQERRDRSRGVDDGCASRSRPTTWAAAPDRRAMYVPRSVRRPARPTPRCSSEVEQFLYPPGGAARRKRWQDWIDLFADDGVYWMPVEPRADRLARRAVDLRRGQADDGVRMGRAAASRTPGRRRRCGAPTTSSPTSSIEARRRRRRSRVRSRFQMMELRRDDVRHFGGSYRHIVVRTAEGLRIRLQRVDMMNGQAPYDYVLQGLGLDAAAVPVPLLLARARPPLNRRLWSRGLRLRRSWACGVGLLFIVGRGNRIRP